VQLFCENTGFMRKAGKELNAKLVFMEHRYYGKSIPDDKNLYLSAEQALADYAEYLVHLKSSGKIQNIQRNSIIVKYNNSLFFYRNF